MLITALTINAQISSYSKYDVEYGVVYDVEDMDSEEIKTYNSFIENGMIKGSALLYINAGRAHDNLIDAPATIIDYTFNANDEDNSENNGKVSVLIQLINTTPKTIKEITLEFEFENNSSPVYDIKTGDKYLVLKYTNIKGRTNSNKYTDIVNSIIDCISYMRNQEASFEKPFYNKKARIMKLHKAQVKYNDGSVSTKIAKFSNGYSGKDDLFEDGPLSPVYKILHFLDELKKDDVPKRNSTVIIPAPAKKTDEIFKSAAHMPSFPGGDAALMSYVNRNIIYPKNALDNKIEGKVIVQFVVNKDGSIGEVKVARGVNKELDEEAIRVIKSISEPNILGERKILFSPGKNAVGDPVNVWYTLPITFKPPIAN